MASKQSIIWLMKVWELGEFGLIELLAEVVAQQRKLADDGLVIGIGDDAAVWRAGEELVLGTTDSLVEGTHFRLTTTTWRDLGWKALAVNISDIAAMGGIPRHVLVSLCLPPDTEVDSVTELYQGLAEVAAKFGVAIAGGNVTRAPSLVINISVVGAGGPGILTRSAALPGESIAVTGYLGQAAAGLRMLNSGLKFGRKTTAFLRQAHLRPAPRVDEGRLLIEQGVRAAIDLSDGLLSDLGHICKASGVGARLWLKRLPIHPLVRKAFGEDALGLALSGGEDYELLFTAEPELVNRLKRLMPCPVTEIGQVVGAEPAEVLLLDDKGRVVDWAERGWDHFRRDELCGDYQQ